ncbi:MAG: hypothetical protein FD155_2241 [Bacteroidetes bacterium]|nr:MAG: hypothetical protein FD155_2241 [Bacteroidota bacterium]
MPHLLSKSTFIRGQQCQKSLYLNKKRPFLRDKISSAQLAKFKRGTDVGILAQQLFPGGIDCKPKSPSQYQKKLEETSELMNDLNVHTIYEAVFQYDDVLIMLDIIVRDNNHWKAYEVKSSRSLSQTYYTDAALQYYVINGCGVILSDFCLIYVDESYVFQEQLEINKLFKTQSVLKDVKERLLEIKSSIAQSKLTLSLENSPKVPIGEQCTYPYPCDFIGHCWKNIPENSFLFMSSLSPEIRFSNFTDEKSTISDLPSEVLETEIQKLQFEAFKTSQIFINESLEWTKHHSKSTVNTICFFKLLSYNPAVPFLNGMKPYSFIPVVLSYSINELSETMFFSQTTEGFTQFIEKTEELLQSNEVIFTDDYTHFYGCHQSVLEIMDSVSPRPDKTVFTNVFDIQRLISNYNVIFPFSSKDVTLTKILKALTGETLNLKDENYLLTDLLNSNDSTETSLLLGNLANYTKAIKMIYNGLNKLFSN